MLDKLVSFLISGILMGVIALIAALGVYFLSAILFILALVPMAVALGDELTRKICHLVQQDYVFVFIYFSVLLVLMIDEFKNSMLTKSQE